MIKIKVEMGARRYNCTMTYLSRTILTRAEERIWTRVAKAAAGPLSCALTVATLTGCAGIGDSQLRYSPAKSASGNPCINWRGENVCQPNQSVGRTMRSRWTESDLMLPPLKLAALPAPRSRGARALARYCTTCHNLPSPTMHSAGDWKPILARMHARTKLARSLGRLPRNAIPTVAARRELEAYINNYALRGVGVNRLITAGSVGARAYGSHCSTCHALPDPALHAPGKWSAIVDRMFRYQKNEGRAVPAANTIKLIKDYLRQGR